ncbi:hypothetical protein mRhiFer1_009253 [Rhinolophus ferrumequinum]|uniref:BPTI/Kunitz inhibitor domain-containing protein n=1 Tax=Rhinolophus ferrumequinum TaxID=59479 RepID=A0A671G2H5_RHIFE|nr:glutamic acid-rich protein [Rhinolophus ferrumequinum]KAF6284500.1 hypothetical protein mRhiFer1_009253 [Rhinolophus ferrumequinum]
MDPLCLSAALLIFLNIQAAGAQGSDTVSPSQRRPVFCLEPPYKGPGRAVLPRFFFNTRSGFCEAFVFGGGRAKLNNFLTKDECTRVCSGRKPAFETQYQLELQAQPALKDKPVDKTQDKGPACRHLEPENQDGDGDSDLKDDDDEEDEKPEDEKPENQDGDGDSDLKDDDDEEDEKPEDEKPENQDGDGDSDLKEDDHEEDEKPEDEKPEDQDDDDDYEDEDEEPQG